MKTRALQLTILAALVVTAPLGCGGDQENVKKEEAIKHRTPPDEPWRKERPAAGPTTEARFPTFVKETLGTGLTIFVIEEHALPIVDVRFVTHFGSAQDSAKAPGLVSLAYDMLDEGAGGMGSAELAEAFAKLGTTLRVGADREAGNVATGVLKRNLEGALALIATVVQKPTFDKDRFEKVRSERQSSITQAKGEPMAMAFETLAQVAYGADHPYGMRSLGTPESIEKAKVADVKKLWTDNVGPGNSAVVLAGDITLDEAKKLVEAQFGKWKNKAKRPTAPKDPTAPKSLLHVVKGPTGSPQTVIVFGRPLLAVGDPDETAAEVLNQIVGGMFTSRLNMKLREEKRWSYGAWSSVDARLGRGPFLAGSSVVSAQAVPALDEALKVFDALAKEPVTDEELALAKANLVKSLPSKLETVGALGGAAVELFVYNLPLDYFATREAAVSAVTKDDVTRVAAKALAREGLAIILVGDAAALEEPLKAHGEVSLVEPGATPAR